MLPFLTTDGPHGGEGYRGLYQLGCFGWGVNGVLVKVKPPKTIDRASELITDVITMAGAEARIIVGFLCHPGAMFLSLMNLSCL